MTPPLTVTWPGGILTDPTSAVTIGRDPQNTVSIDVPVISRTHAAIVLVNGRWVFRDLGSSFGTFVQGRRVGEIPIDGPMVLTLGQGEDAVQLGLRIDRQTMEDPQYGAQPVLAPTSVGQSRPPIPESGPARPGGALGVGRADPTLVRGDDGGPTLTVTEGGNVHQISSRTGATIGREADNTIVLDEPTVSRHHLRIEYAKGRWAVTDLGSGSGTWAGGSRIGELAVTGKTLLTVGDPATGPRLELLPDAVGETGGRAAGRNGSRRWIAIACAVVLVAAIGVGSWWFFLREPTAAAADLGTLAQGTVKLNVTTAQGDAWSGSGTVIDAERGLILTNAHVAAPLAVGLSARYADFFPSGPDPADEIIVSVAPGLDRTAESRYRGELVGADGYLDMAVVKITHTLSGAPVTPADLESLVAIPIGDSDAVATGDQVIVVGYPGQVESQAATISRGVITGSEPDDRLSAPRALYLSDAFSGSGNSGGLVANAGGEIIGVHSIGTIPRKPTENALGGSRPVNFARPLIDAARAGTEYVSPWAQAMPDGASLDATSFSGPGPHFGVDGTCEKSDDVDSLVAVAVDYSGFGATKHTDVLARLLHKSPAGEWQFVEQTDSATTYPVELDDSGCFRATLPVPVSSLDPGDYTVVIGVGGDYALTTQLDFTIS